QRLLQVDDVDVIAPGHDEARHLGVPPTGLVPEVDAALEELAHGDDGHAEVSLSVGCAVGPGTGGDLHPTPMEGTRLRRCAPAYRSDDRRSRWCTSELVREFVWHTRLRAHHTCDPSYGYRAGHAKSPCHADDRLQHHDLRRDDP